ncbi:MAG: hypothetical protein IR160_03460 [Salinibacterium sp.]|nr:hypothetical protein [Salinibacterium sp.]MBF0671624.1 hypothetical protein [Salinibacterium sp.]
MTVNDDAQATPPGNAARLADVLGSILLLVLAVGLAVPLSFAGLFLAMSADGCSTDCPLWLFEFFWLWSLVSPFVVAIATIAWTVVRLVKRRRAWLIALLGIPTVFVVWVIAPIVIFAMMN